MAVVCVVDGDVQGEVVGVNAQLETGHLGQ